MTCIVRLVTFQADHDAFFNQIDKKGLCHRFKYHFQKPNTFFYQRRSKNNDIVLLTVVTKTVNVCFFFAADGQVGNGLQLEIVSATSV